MKQVKSLLAVFLLAGTFLTSCSKSDTTNPVDETPSINFVGATGYISADATLTVGESFKVGINAFSNATSGSKLTKLTITRVFNNIPVTQDTILSTATLNIVINATAAASPGPEKWYFKVTDKDNQSKEISLTITTVANAGDINTFSMKIMGAQASTTGSSFASIDGSVYDLTLAKLNAAKVDWMYYYGATNLATIAAPSDPSATEVFTGTNGPGSWSVRNATKFKDVSTTVDFASVTDDSKIILAATGSTVTLIPQLSAGKVLAFIAANGKMGLIKVETITGNSNTGSMTISVKVQK